MASPAKNQDLHGYVPTTCPVALLLIDVINDFEFPGSQPLLAQFTPLLDRVVALKQRAREAGVPVVYVNDNFGRWQSDFGQLLDHCLHQPVKGQAIARALQPDPKDYAVLKPKHSAFYATTLEVLLDYLQARTLVLAGVAGNSCVLFTANDAYMRDYRLLVPRDCVASAGTGENRQALGQMAKLLKADTRPSTQIDFPALLQQPTAP